MLVFTSYITLKNGKRLYASECGKKAFCFESDGEKNKTKTSKTKNNKNIK